YHLSNLGCRHDHALTYISFIRRPYRDLDSTHVYHLYCVESDQRDEFRNAPTKQNISPVVYYPRCLHLQKAYEHLGYKLGDFPIAESLSEKLFALPLYPGLLLEEQDYIIERIKRQVSE